MSNQTVQKGYHCTWQIHYHIVFPVKYCKSEMKEEFWGGEFWTDGYYVATVGKRANWDVVEKYVQNQGQPKAVLKQLKLFE